MGRSAIYGRRDKKTCRRSMKLMKDTNCASEDSYSKMSQKCKNKQLCTVKASNGIFGDPCVGTYKYLEVEYMCLPDTLRIVSCEHQRMSMTCPLNYVISIDRASYGRFDSST